MAQDWRESRFGERQRDSLGGVVGDFSLALSFLKGFLLIVRRLHQQTKKSSRRRKSFDRKSGAWEREARDRNLLRLAGSHRWRGAELTGES